MGLFRRSKEMEHCLVTARDLHENRTGQKQGRVAGAMSRPCGAKGLGTCSSTFSTPGFRNAVADCIVAAGL